MLKIYYPFKPYHITQEWGNPNPIYAGQFNDPSFKLHNGIDAKPNILQIGKDYKYPVYCPVEGFVVDKVQYRPGGGGNEIWLLSKDNVQMFEENCRAYLVLCHAEKILVKAGDEPKLGQLLMIGDNTGFSTGPHTHLGLYRYRQVGGSFEKIDTNEATGSFNPALFFTDQFAIDKAELQTLINNNLRYYQWVVTGG